MRIAEKNLTQIFHRNCEKYKSRPALFYKNTKKQYTSYSWQQWHEAVEFTALGLYGQGVRFGDRIAILSENCPEWTFADLGALSLGAVVVPIYPTSSASDVSLILQDSGAKVLFISTSSQLDRVADTFKACPELEHVVVFESTFISTPFMMRLDELQRNGRSNALNNDRFWTDFINQAGRDDLATLIYTSGTTGRPKGVMLTHGNFISNIEGATSFISVNEKDLALSFLPLSHVFERLAGYYFMMCHGASIAYAESMQTVADDIVLIRPTVAAAVPRFYEKIHGRIYETVQKLPKVLQRLFQWAIDNGLSYAKSKIAGQKIPYISRCSYVLAQWLVFNKIHKRLGGRIRFFISGGAPLNPELAFFFYAAGVMILEGYGLTETSPVIAVNSPKSFEFGSVGKILPNVKVQIAQDGEILTSGPCVMKGYYKNIEATNKVMNDGWFRTGDIGLITDKGFLKITDRKKDIIVTSGGKNIAPQKIENILVSDPYIHQAVVVGDKRNYLSALLVPNREELMLLAVRLNIHQDYHELLKNPLILQWIEKRVIGLMSGLPSYERIKRFALLENEFTINAGDLTPTLKVKRKIVTEKYSDLIQSLYNPL